MYTLVFLHKLLVYRGYNFIVTHAGHLGFKLKSPPLEGVLLFDISNSFSTLRIIDTWHARGLIFCRIQIGQFIFTCRVDMAFEAGTRWVARCDKTPMWAPPMRCMSQFLALLTPTLTHTQFSIMLQWCLQHNTMGLYTTQPCGGCIQKGMF